MKTKIFFGQPKYFGVFLNILLLLLLSLSIFRFVNYFITFSHKSLQMDFSAYYTAGESLNYGLSPYKNFVQNQPPVWDGINRYKYSRFLYPPLVASLFQPIATLPYHVAKWIWGGLELLAVIATFMIVERFYPAISFRRIVFVCILTLWYFPLLIHLERGQIDVFTLLLITLAICFIVRKDKLGDHLSGVLLAFAVLLKLYVIFFLPFIFFQKRLRILYGFGLGTALILLLSIFFQKGTTQLFDYAYNQLPRMANIGDIAKSNTLVNTKPIRAILAQTPPGSDTIKDGHGYSLGSLDFITNATLVEPLEVKLATWGVTSKAGISMGLFGLFFVAFLFWKNHYIHDNFSVIEEYLYWQIPTVITLLVSPITWTMNMVWLLPLFSVSIYLFSIQMPVSKRIPIILISLALMIAMLPDVFNTPSLSFASLILGEYKYIYSECLTLLGLLLFLGKKKGFSSV